MGMSASQAQLLSITSRMSDNELRAQIISNDKQRLATESSQVSGHYVETLQATNMQFASYDKSNNQISEKLTFNNLTRFNKLNAQYGISNLAGQLYVSEKDADMFQRAIAARDPLTSFLNEQGFFYETSYFDNLDKYLVNGDKVAYRGQNARGEMTTLSTDYTVDQLKTMYFGESPLTNPNGIYHKGMEKLTPDFNIYTDLVSRTQGLAKEFNKLVAKDLASFTINNIGVGPLNGITHATLTANSVFGNNETAGTIGNIIKQLGGMIRETTGNGSTIDWGKTGYNPNYQYTNLAEELKRILTVGMEADGLLSSKGSKTLEGVKNGDPVNGVWANAYEKTTEMMKPQSYAARLVDANGNVLDRAPQVGDSFAVNYNPYEPAFEDAFVAPPFEIRYEITEINKDEFGNVTYKYKDTPDWYTTKVVTSDGEPYDAAKVASGAQTLTIERTKLNNGGNGPVDGDGVTPTQNGVQDVSFTLDLTKLDAANVAKIKAALLASQTSDAKSSAENAQNKMAAAGISLGYEPAIVKDNKLINNENYVIIERQRQVPVAAYTDSEGVEHKATTRIVYYREEYKYDDPNVTIIYNTNTTTGIVDTIALIKKPIAQRTGTEAYGANSLLTAINNNSIAVPDMPTDDAAKNQQLAKNYANSVMSYVNTNLKPATVKGVSADGTPILADGVTQEDPLLDQKAINQYMGAYKMAQALQAEAAKANSTAAGVKGTASAKATEVDTNEYNAILKPAIDNARTEYGAYESADGKAKLDIDAQTSIQIDAKFKDLEINTDNKGALSYNTNYAKTERDKWDYEWLDFVPKWFFADNWHDEAGPEQSVGNFQKIDGYGHSIESGNNSEYGGTDGWDIFAGVMLTVFVPVLGAIVAIDAENDRRKREAREEAMNRTQEGALYNFSSIIRNQQYSTTPTIDEKGNVTFTDNNTNQDGTKAADSHEEERFLALRQILEEFLGSFSPETEYSPAEMMNASYISLDDNHPAKVIWDQLMRATEELSEFLFGDKNASKDYNGMCDMDGLRAWYDNPNAAKTPQNAENQTMRNVIDGGMLERVFNTYGEPKLGWVDKEGNDCEKEAQWYTNLFNRMKEGYKALEDGLAADPKWIDYALKSGLAVMEQVDGTNAWSSMIYTNCADITESKDSTSVAIAEAEYNREMSKIQAKDKRCDMELKQIDTEHNSLQVEYDSIKAALDKNMERTLKIYSA